jgi:hypothetical protein
MNSNYKGELMLADGTPVGKVVDWHIVHESIEVPTVSFKDMFDRKIEATIEGTFTPGEGLLGLIDIIFHDYQSSKVCVYVSNEAARMLEYARQGKWYPSHKRRKSQSRMSRKWRGRA